MRANATAAVSTEQLPLASADRSDRKSVTTERNLIERISNGETELFYDLIRPYQRSVFLAGISILGNEADAEEVAQEALLKAFRSLMTFRHESKFRTVFVLRDMEQLSIAETAKVLAISEQNVKTRLLRARLQLRDLLAPLLRAEQSAKVQ